MQFFKGPLLVLCAALVASIDLADKGYADYNAPDWSTDHLTVVPLSDFFNLNSPRAFNPISTPYAATTFTEYYSTPQNGVYPVPTGPDAVAGEDED